MIFIAGLSPRLKQLGVASATCPGCGLGGRLNIVRQGQYISLFFIPIIPLGRGEYIATCGGCAGIFLLNQQAGRRFERSPDIPIGRGEFELYRQGYGGACNHCGRPAEEGHTFCPGCGNRI